MGLSKPLEIDPRDQSLLRQIGRLRVLACRKFQHRPHEGDCWLDSYELSARHWAIFNEETPIAAARLSIHQRLDDVPDAEIYKEAFKVPPCAPIASLNRLVVHPDFQGKGLSKNFDDIRLNAAMESGCRSVIGETHSGSSRLAQLRALGFFIIGPALPYPPGHCFKGRGVVIHRTLDSTQLPEIHETLNQMGWSSDVINEVTHEFLNYAAQCQHPVLDIGSAFGLATIPALKKGATVFANDLAPNHLSELRSRVPPHLLSRLKTIPGKFPHDLAFSDESLDAIHASNVLHFLTPDEIETGLKLAFRWLRPGGRIFVVAATPYQATHAGFSAVFLQRKASGDPWPGFIENIRDYSTHWSANILPSWLHVFDIDVLSAAFQRVGFKVEKAKMFSRAGLPEFCRLDGRENLGIIANKSSLLSPVCISKTDSLCSSVEIVRINDSSMLENVYRLRAEVWAGIGVNFSTFPNGKWKDEHDYHAMHWGVINQLGAIVAAARMCVHDKLQEVPESDCYLSFQAEIPLPVASINRLVVKREFRGFGISKMLDIARISTANTLRAQSIIGNVREFTGESRLTALVSIGFRALAPTFTIKDEFTTLGHGKALPLLKLL